MHSVWQQLLCLPIVSMQLCKCTHKLSIVLEELRHRTSGICLMESA